MLGEQCQGERWKEEGGVSHHLDNKQQGLWKLWFNTNNTTGITQMLTIILPLVSVL